MWKNQWPKSPLTQKRKAWARQENKGLCVRNAQSREGIKGGEHELKSSHILHTTRDKHQLESTTESNKHGGSKNGVKARKKQIQMEWSLHKGPRHHLLVPSQYMGSEPWVKVFRGCRLVVRRKRGSISRFLLKFLLGRDVLLGLGVIIEWGRSEVWSLRPHLA